MRFLLFILIFLSLYSCKSEKQDFVKDKNKFETMISPALENVMQPFLFSSGDKLLMSWTKEINDSITSLNYAEFKNDSWSTSKEIARGVNWFVNWADFPAIAENNGNIILHYLPKSDAATFAYDVFVKLYHANASEWKSPFKLHSDSTKTEHGFVSLIPYKNDSFFTTWLDGRNTSGGHDHNGDGAMTLRAAEVKANGIIENEVLLDARTCDCCQTSATTTQNGPVVVYRDRSDDEIRDIYISRYIDGDWTLPRVIHNDNWKIAGCPVNGPKVISKNNTLAIAWFTNAQDIAKVNIVFSKDNGKTFEKPLRVDNEDPVGRVDIALLDENNALVSWIENNKESAEIRVAKINILSGKTYDLVVDKIAASRASGFPQMEIIGDNVVFAYNLIENERRSIGLKKINKAIFQDN